MVYSYAGSCPRLDHFNGHIARQMLLFAEGRIREDIKAITFAAFYGASLSQIRQSRLVTGDVFGDVPSLDGDAGPVKLLP